jgi:hypothetical protein
VVVDCIKSVVQDLANPSRQIVRSGLNIGKNFQMDCLYDNIPVLFKGNTIIPKYVVKVENKNLTG